jgi:hypothetical protein
MANGKTREEAIACWKEQYISLRENESPGMTFEFSPRVIVRDATPHHSIADLVDVIMGAAKSPRRNLAIGSVLCLLSSLMAGSYVSPDSDGALQLYYLVHAKAAGGKGSYGSIPSTIMMMIDPVLERMLMLIPSSVQGFLNTLDDCNARLLECPEAGEFFDNLKDKRSNVYALRPMLRSGWNSEKVIGTQPKKKSDSCPTCGYPVLTMWCAMTATQASETMSDRRTATDGFLSRISFITTAETIQNETRSTLVLPEESMQKLRSIARRLVVKIEEGKNNKNTSNPESSSYIQVSMQRKIGISNEAWILAKALEEETRLEAIHLEETGNEVMASLMARLYEKTMRVASLIAAFECASLPEEQWIIQKSHIEWARDWERIHIDNLKEVSAFAAEESEHAKLKKSILVAIDSVPMEIRVNEYWVKYADMRRTNKGNLRNAKPHEIIQAIIDLEESNIIETDAEHGKRPRIIRKKV